MKKLKDSYLKIADNRIFCMLMLFLGVGYITWFGFLKNPLHNTASVIAVDHKGLYYLWVIFTVLALFINITYMYRNNGYKSKAGIISMYLSFACIIMTIIVPHAESGIPKLIHWSAALAFGVFSAAAIVFFLINKSKINRKYLYTLLFFIFVLALMIVLLILFKENGVIESLPMWCAYMIIFLVNFTGLYKVKQTKEAAAVTT